MYPATSTPRSTSCRVVYRDYIGFTIVYWGYMGIMEKKMETTIVYWGYNGLKEKEMETTT